MVRMTGGVVLIWLVYLVGGAGDVNGRTGGEVVGWPNLLKTRLSRNFNPVCQHYLLLVGLDVVPSTAQSRSYRRQLRT